MSAIDPAIDPLTHLHLLTAADHEPALTISELDQLLRLARRADAAGRAPGDPGWVPTYDLNWAAAEGWRLKAGRAAAQFGFVTDGQTFHREQVMEHCERMAERFARRLVAGVSIGRRRTRTEEV